MDKSKIIQKWSPVMENMGLINKHLIDIMCLFCEDYSIKNHTSDELPKRVKMILEKIEKIKKSVVKNTLYNPITGEIEYELENGFIITEKNKFKREPTIDELVDLFGIDFIRELDKQEFRENRLNKIL